MQRKMTMILQLLVFMGFLHSTCGQSSNRQNLETFYPSSSSSSSSSSLPPSLSPPNASFFVTPPGHGTSSNNDVAKAVAITAAGTFVFSSVLFFLIQRWRKRRRRVVADDHTSVPSGLGGGGGMIDHNARFSRVGSKVKGMIVDENGLDVIYWRKLEEGSNGGGTANGASPREKEESLEEKKVKRWKKEAEPIQEVPLLRGKSSGSHLNGCQENHEGTNNNFNGELYQRSSLSLPPPPAKHSPPPPPPPPLPAPPPSAPALALAVKRSPGSGSGPPPPPPPIPKAGAKAASDYKGKKLVSLEAGERERGSNGQIKLKPLERGSNGQVKLKPLERGSNGQVKLKPLHWDKVNKNTDHSMVWDKLGTGSFRFDDNLMEALFGYVATNRKSPKRDGSSKPKANSPPAQVVILEPRKSQNTAIVIKSLSISRKEILDALTDGYGLDVDILEKLVKITPSKEEELQILEFQGDANKLADAESFLYCLLKAVPSAFSRFNAMYFRLSYDTDVRQFKENLETLELGSKELRNRGLFTKLLEAILKAGNRMNAGTARGNAQAFKLCSLMKLSDVKSTDGKTTLLHFVVEEVVRSEGKKLVLNGNSSTNSNSSLNSESSVPKEERDREYKMLGLPVVGGLSSEFSNVKKAAQIDYETFSGTLLALSARIRDIKLIVARIAAAGEPGGGFVKEMKAFYETAEEELNGLKQDQKRVMGLVKSTIGYYQAGAANDSAAHQLQLFVIIKDFLLMVDQVCIEVARSLQRKKARQLSGSGSPGPKAPKGPVRFPNLPAHFLGERSKSSSSESDSEQ